MTIHRSNGERRMNERTLYFWRRLSIVKASHQADNSIYLHKKELNYSFGEQTLTKSIPIFGESTPTYGIKEQRKIIKDWAKGNLSGTIIKLEKYNLDVVFTNSGIKEALNQPHKHQFHKNEAIRKIIELLKSARLIKKEPDTSGNLNYEYYYLETKINNEPSYIVLRKTKKEEKIVFYSIVDHIKE